MPIALSILVLALEVFLKLCNLSPTGWQTVAELFDDQAMANALIALGMMVELSDAQQVFEVSLPYLYTPQLANIKTML